jgi:Rrf2 family nitric oxide-sensitive transcriptional repressor
MQLMLSTDIALRTLIYLGKKNEPATIQEVAEAFEISKTHLMKVVMTLVSAGLLASERGRNGGIRLAQEARNISVGDVVRLMEANLALVVCMKEEATNDVCPLLPSCRLKKVLGKAQDAFFDSLDQSTLADLLK